MEHVKLAFLADASARGGGTTESWSQATQAAQGAQVDVKKFRGQSDFLNIFFRSQFYLINRLIGHFYMSC